MSRSPLDSGLNYHPSCGCDDDETLPKLKYQTVFSIDDVPGHRMKDPAFWAMLFGLWMRRKPPSEHHRVEVIYDVLLPWLAEQKHPRDGSVSSTSGRDGIPRVNRLLSDAWRESFGRQNDEGDVIMKDDDDDDDDDDDTLDGDTLDGDTLDDDTLDGDTLDDDTLDGDTLDGDTLDDACHPTPTIGWKTKVRSLPSSHSRCILHAMSYLLKVNGWDQCMLKQLSFVVREEMIKRCGRELIDRFAIAYPIADDAVDAIAAYGITPTPRDGDGDGGGGGGGDAHAFPWELVDGCLMDGDGNTIDGSSLRGTHIALYFSAHWCGPCRSFTPMLAEMYSAIGAKRWGPHGGEDGGALEVIFVSFDRSVSDFNEYRSTMPWLAVDYSRSGVRERLGSLFSITSVPSLVLFDRDGAVLPINGVEMVTSDPSGSAFPWTLPTEPSLSIALPRLEGNLLDAHGSAVGVDESLGGAVVGLYFSAHWCAPCRAFTPLLASLYNRLNDRNVPFEVVFVSSDSNEEEWMSYFTSMPWKVNGSTCHLARTQNTKEAANRTWQIITRTHTRTRTITCTHAHTHAHTITHTTTITYTTTITRTHHFM